MHVVVIFGLVLTCVAAYVVTRARRPVQRSTLRKQPDLSPLTEIDDPVVAAATILVALVSDDVALSDPRAAAIRVELEQITSPDKAQAALIRARLAADKIDETTTVIDTLAPFLAERLYDDEKHALIEMTRGVFEAHGPDLPTGSQHIRRLTQKLGLEVH